MTLQEIQYKAQGIIHKWRDDDSAPYIEFVEELAHMTVPEPSEDLEEAADNHSANYDSTIYYVLESSNQKTIWRREHNEIFIAGAKWQADHAPLLEDTVLFNKGVEEGRRLAEEEQADLFTIVALDAAQRAKEQMLKEAVEGEICIPNVWVEHIEGKELVVRAEISKELGFKFGDKVRVIVCKKED